MAKLRSMSVDFLVCPRLANYTFNSGFNQLKLGCRSGENMVFQRDAVYIDDAAAAVVAENNLYLYNK